MSRTLLRPGISVKDHLDAEQITSLEKLIREERIGARMTLREFLTIAAIVAGGFALIWLALAVRTGGLQ